MTDLRALSFQHCPRGAMPAAPTNEERRRIWRDCQPVQLHNEYQWDHIKRAEYSRAEMADAQDRETDPEFSFSYGRVQAAG